VGGAVTEVTFKEKSKKEEARIRCCLGGEPYHTTSYKEGPWWPPLGWKHAQQSAISKIYLKKNNAGFAKKMGSRGSVVAKPRVGYRARGGNVARFARGGSQEAKTFVGEGFWDRPKRKEDTSTAGIIK